MVSPRRVCIDTNSRTSHAGIHFGCRDCWAQRDTDELLPRRFYVAKRFREGIAPVLPRVDPFAFAVN